MRRRKHNTSDSLELLLDTICNIFGGVILMAILIVIQTRVSASHLSKPKPQDGEEVLQVRKLRFECERLTQKIEDVLEQKQNLMNNYQATASPVTAQLLESRSEFTEALRLATQEEKRIRDELNDSKKIASNNEMALKEIIAKSNATLTEIKTTKARLKTTNQKPLKQLRLPRRHYDASRSVSDYVIKGRQAYYLDNVNYFGGPHKSGQCMVEPLSRVLGICARITPIENEGYSVSTEGESTEFLRSLGGYRSSTHSVQFFVFGDSESFASFQQLKHTVLAKGYSYAVSAYFPENALVVSPVAAVPVE